MPNYRLTPSVIRWGVNLANAVYFPFPMDSVFSGSETRPGGEQVQLPSGVEDAWRIGTDYVLLGTHGWLAQSDTLYYPRCTGWDGALGIRAALEYLQDKHPFPWHPDGRNLIRYPMLTSATIDRAPSTSALAGWTSAATASTSGVTVSFDAGTGAWKMVGTSTGTTQWVEMFQYFPAVPGEQMYLSVDYKVSGLGTGANAALFLDNDDTPGSYLGTVGSLVNQTASTGGFTRIITPLSSAFLANTAYGRVSLRLQLPSVGSTGTVWFRNVMVRRDSGDATFIDNPFVDGCYLVDPIQFTPANETDGSRQLVAKIRNPTIEFAGY